MAVWVLVVSPVGYLMFGSPGAFDTRGVASASQRLSTEQVEGFADELAARVESTPDDLEAWRMLARWQHVLGRYREAAEAYARVLSLGGRNPDVLVRYAVSLVRANGGRIADEPYRHVEEALALEPKHAAALAMAGHAEAQRGNYVAAVDLWEKLAKELPPGSEIAPAVRGLIDNARKHAAANFAR